MAVAAPPVFIGSTLVSTSGSAPRTIIPHASTLTGDLIIVIGVTLVAGATADPAGWRALKSATTTGTLSSGAWAKKRESGDTSYSFTVAASTNSQHLCLTFRAWEGDVANLIVGATGTRAASGGAAVTNAPGVTTTAIDNLVLTIGTDRSTATETGITSVDNGFTTLVWAGHAAGGIETIWVGTKAVASASATGQTAITYPNAQASNAMAFQVAIAPGVVAPVVGFGWFSSVEETAIRCGWSIANATSVRMVVSGAASLESPIYSAPATPSASGWVTARVTGLFPGNVYYIGIEANGVLLATGRLQGSTMMAGERSFKFLTGSCQYTGSNHAVFDTMRAENADFLLHQGDLHYADTFVEATWRAQFAQSMMAPRFAQLIATLPMTYCWDNHDYAGQGFEADDWDNVNNPQKFIRELTGEYVGTTEIYKTWVNGRVRFIQTDQWSERDDDAAAESASKRCMSAEQEAWLYATLESAAEPLIIWATAWPLYRSVPGGRWGSYTTQRNRIKAWLAARPDILDRLVGIGGDSHSVSSDSGANQDALGPFPTLNASGFDQSGGLPSGTWDIVNFDTVAGDGYYSRVTIVDDFEIDFLWEAVDQAGTVIGTWGRQFGGSSEGLPVSLVIDADTTVDGRLWLYNGTEVIPVVSAQIAP